MRNPPFEEIVAEHGPVVLRVCRALLPPSDADDAWSETFISALRAYPDLPDGSNVRAWLVTIAQRRSIDQIRRRDRAPVPSGRVPETTSTEAIPEPHDDDLRAALRRLPPKQQTAVVARYLADLPYRDVARLLDSNEAAARRNAADGGARLRTTYQKDPTP